MSEMPRGAVTFLFTDIQGSTRLVKQLRDRYGAVLADHQRILRAAFAAHRGYEVDTQGDSFFVAFASARDAVLAAVEAQRTLAAHAWPDGVEIAVRMGLHTGQAVAHDGRYTGLAVHRAARIGAAGHGGQILVSQATQTLLEDEEEELHLSLLDLGEQRLKDLDRPVRLYQVVSEGVRTSFPPLRGDADPAPSAAVAIAEPLRRRRLRLAAAAAVVLVLALVLVAAVAFLRSGSGGGGLASVQANSVGVIDPATNEIVAEVPVGIRPGPIAVGEGSVWVGNLDDRTVTEIEPEQRTAARTIALDGRTPTGLAVGLGAVWVAHGVRGELTRVDPQFGQLAEPLLVGGTAFGSADGSVTLGAASVWVAYGDSTFARLDASGRILAQTVAGTQPAALVFGGGSVWVANAGDATVQRFSPTTFDQGPLRTFNVGRRPTGLAFVDDAIWVANAGDDVVTRIDPSSGATLPIRVGRGPTAVAGAPGSIWVANALDHTLSRIDTATNEVVATIAIGNAPSGLTLANGHLWVAVQAP